MKDIPTIDENPKGLHQKYVIRKVTGVKRNGFIGRPTLVTTPVDSDAEYFILRLDDRCKDKKHVEACRKAVLHYADLIKDHIPELSKDLIERYKNK